MNNTSNELNDFVNKNNQWQISKNKKHNWHPPTDVYETENAINIQVEIAGMDKNDFNLTYEKNFVLIQGKRKQIGCNFKKAYHQVEIGYGEFETKIVLTTPIDQTKIVAEYDNGFLTIILPKSSPKQIKIQQNGK